MGVEVTLLSILSILWGHLGSQQVTTYPRSQSCKCEGQTPNPTPLSLMLVSSLFSHKGVRKKFWYCFPSEIKAGLISLCECYFGFSWEKKWVFYFCSFGFLSCEVVRATTARAGAELNAMEWISSKATGEGRAECLSSGKGNCLLLNLLFLQRFFYGRSLQNCLNAGCWNMRRCLQKQGWVV